MGDVTRQHFFYSAQQKNYYATSTYIQVWISLYIYIYAEYIDIHTCISMDIFIIILHTISCNDMRFQIAAVIAF